MKVLSHDEFHDLSYDKRKIIAGAVAKKFIENFDEEELHFQIFVVLCPNGHMRVGAMRSMKKTLIG